MKVELINISNEWRFWVNDEESPAPAVSGGFGFLTARIVLVLFLLLGEF